MGVRGGVGPGKCEPLTLFHWPVKALHTHECPGLVTGPIPSQREAGKQFSHLGWELFVLDEKFQVETI